MKGPLVRHTRGDLPAIAVLPFFCIPHGTVDREFGEGIAFSLAATLMTFPDFNVISASSTLGYWADATPTLSQVSKLGARYLLFGHIVQADQTLTFTYRLKDLETDEEHAFAPLDIHLSDLHNVDAYIVERVITRILPRLRKAEIDKALTRSSAVFTSHETLLRAISAMHHLDDVSHQRAERLLRNVQALDPRWAPPFAWHSRLVSMRIGMGRVENRRQACLQSLQLATTALDRDPENAQALATAGHLHSYLLKDTARGMAMMQRAIDACPSEPYAWLMLGTSLAYVGRTKAATRHARHALRLSPLDPYASFFHSFLALCLYADGDYETAIHHANIAIEQSPNYSSTWCILAASLAAAGHLEDAKRAGKKIIELEPQYPRIAKDTVPFQDASQRNDYLARLVLAEVLDASSV
ncbi:MAG: hypothetical protein R3D67_19815 [Hyphomicrobiaceae bacterium]